MIWVLAAACAVAVIPTGLRWLRVAQREHYLAPSVSRFWWRWWSHRPTNISLSLLGVVGLIGSAFDVRLGFLTVVAHIGPVGLGLRGRTSPLAWTSRLRRVSALAGVLVTTVLVVGVLLGLAPLLALALISVPFMVDLALWLLAPVERWLGTKWVRKASAALDRSGARVVAITGSYGKTTTKQYLLHLIGDTVRAVASPASFNNRMGLARAVNEQLVPGTEVFIAEMGTYGPGEIADLCSWVKPEISALVSIGPVHLEKFGTEENIVRAKAEILDGASVGVIATDNPLLAQLAVEKAAEMRIVTVGSRDATDVGFEPGSRMISLAGEALGRVPDDVFALNLTVAVAVADALGIEVDPDKFSSVPRAEHRQSVIQSTSGFAIIDDTFNSNPAGAAVGLEALQLMAPRGRRVLVTPGMVELGPMQDAENQTLARNAAEVCTDVLIIGHTNREPLLRGSANGRASVTVVADRDAAVDWVRQNLTTGDAVLYENDLPDHYP